jgi:hypothetical protein
MKNYNNVDDFREIIREMIVEEKQEQHQGFIEEAEINGGDKMDLSDQELAALHSFVMYKSSYRKENLARVGVEYSLSDPIISGLMDKGFIKLRGKALLPNKEMINKELAKHEAPKGYGILDNASMVFNREYEGPRPKKSRKEWGKPDDWRFGR